MGQAYCVSLCGEKESDTGLQLQGITNMAADEPLQQFARRVKQHIQINPRIKDIYMKYSKRWQQVGDQHHKAERQGKKLELHYLFTFSAYYDGEWRSGVPHGFGRIIYDDGSIYEGCFNYGVAHCQQALFIRRDGSFYRGQIQNNKANGEGQLSTNKFFLKGKWLNDLPHGKGRQIYSQNSFYEGQFFKGVKQGQGYYRWSPSEYYSGQFAKNKLEGRGKLENKECIYEGTFGEGRKEGYGEYYSKSEKFRLMGEFKRNEPKGNGRILYEDGTEFNGTFHGFSRRRGRLTFPNGKEIDYSTDDLQPSSSLNITSQPDSLNQKISR